MLLKKQSDSALLALNQLDTSTTLSECSFNHLRCVSEDEDDESGGAQAVLPEPVAPPAAVKGEVAAAAWTEGGASSSSASWGQFWVGPLPPRPSPGGHIWRNGPPKREREESESDNTPAKTLHHYITVFVFSLEVFMGQLISKSLICM